MGLSSHLHWTPAHSQQQPQVAEDEEETEEDEVAGHTHQGWQEREVEQQVPGEGGNIRYRFRSHEVLKKASVFSRLLSIWLLVMFAALSQFILLLT